MVLQQVNQKNVDLIFTATGAFNKQLPIYTSLTSAYVQHVLLLILILKAPPKDLIFYRRLLILIIKISVV